MKQLTGNPGSDQVKRRENMALNTRCHNCGRVFGYEVQCRVVKSKNKKIHVCQECYTKIRGNR